MQSPRPECRFASGLEGLNARESAKRLHALVAQLPRYAELLKSGVDELKDKKADLAKALELVPAQDRVSAIGLARIEEITTDPIRIIDVAEEIIRQGYRLKAIAEKEICEDWVQTQMVASISELEGSL